MSSKTNQKLNFTPEKDEKLVEAISPHPAIYDLRNPLYKDQRAKDNVWLVISEEVGRSVADCKKCWRNIKDTHDRKMRENHKTGSEAPPGKKAKKWQLQEQLAQLHTADVKRKSFCNITEDNEGSAHEEDDDSFDVSEIEQETPTDAAALISPQLVPPKEMSSKEILSKNETDRPKKTTFRDKVCFAIEKRSKERDAMIKSLLEKDEETDDITLFFKSIAKTVQKMPPSLQQRAKLETLTLISNIEYDMWASRQGTSANNHMIMIASPSSSDASLMSSTSQYGQPQQCGGKILSPQQYDESTRIMDPYNMPSGKPPTI